MRFFDRSCEASIGFEHGSKGVMDGESGESTENRRRDRTQRKKTMPRVPCTKVLSQEIQIFQETSFCVLHDLLRNFTNTLWQLCIDFYTIRIVFESFFQLCILKVATLQKLWQFWQQMCR